MILRAPTGRLRLGLALALTVVLVVASIAAGCVAGGAVVREGRSRETLPLPAPQARVTVRTFNGRIEVKEGSTGKVELEVARRGAGNDEAEAQRDLRKIEVRTGRAGDDLSLEVRRTDAPLSAGESGADVTLAVPSTVTLDVQTSNGAVEVSGVAGSVTARSSNGPVTVTGGSDISVETSNGKVKVSGATGRLDLRSSNGDIEIVDVKAALVTADTSNGRIAFSGTLAEGESSFTSSNGAIQLALPGSARFAIDAATSNGSIDNEFGLAGSDRSLQGTVGDRPGVRIRAQTSNAPIDLQKRG